MKILFAIEEELKNRIKKTYDLELKNKLSKEDNKYLKDAYELINKNDAELEIYYKKILKNIEEEEKNLKIEKKELLKSFNSKREKLEDKKQILFRLKNEKQKEEKLLIQIKNEKLDLENQLSYDKDKEKTKKEKIKSIKNLIANLLQDKDKIKKRSEELKKKLLEQNKTVSGNFKNMRGKLQWPVQGKIKAKYGKEFNEELKTTTENLGIDIECSQNAPISVIMDGIVIAITFIQGYGTLIIVDHGDEYNTVYANIEKISVSEEQYVSTGTIIASASTTSNSKGTLHFEIWEKGQYLNPENWLIKK